MVLNGYSWQYQLQGCRLVQSRKIVLWEGTQVWIKLKPGSTCNVQVNLKCLGSCSISTSSFIAECQVLHTQIKEERAGPNHKQHCWDRRHAEILLRDSRCSCCSKPGQRQNVTAQPVFKTLATIIKKATQERKVGYLRVMDSVSTKK